MRILEYPLVEEGVLSGDSSIIVETSNGTKRMTIDNLKNNLDISATFPIGYIYMSFESTSPAELFGGSWLQLENVFLRAANNLDTGGSDTVTLTVAQMPSHTHKCTSQQRLGDISPGQGFTAPIVNSNKGTVSSAAITSAAGNSNPFSTMPAYQNVYAWRRIS